jgi:hypothetical protein
VAVANGSRCVGPPGLEKDLRKLGGKKTNDATQLLDFSDVSRSLPVVCGNSGCDALGHLPLSSNELSIGLSRFKKGVRT